MITPDKMPKLTGKGQEYLTAYRQFGQVLERFGLG
jgi:hypothetical protein